MERAPCPFRRPPEQSATDLKENTQRDPLSKTCRSADRTKDKHRQDHGEIKGAGVTAMRTAAALRIEDASYTHPGKGHNPNSRANTDGHEETSNDSGSRYPPRQQVGACFRASRVTPE